MDFSVYPINVFTDFAYIREQISIKWCTEILIFSYTKPQYSLIHVELKWTFCVLYKSFQNFDEIPYRRLGYTLSGNSEFRAQRFITNPILHETLNEDFHVVPKSSTKLMTQYGRLPLRFIRIQDVIDILTLKYGTDT